MTQQVLSAQLRALGQDGMVHQEMTSPPLPRRSLYSLTDKGRDLLPARDALALWGAGRLRREGLTWTDAQGPMGFPRRRAHPEESL